VQRKMTWRIINPIKNFNEEEEIMNILSKNTVRTIAVGVVALSISSLGSLAFAAPKVCNDGYLQAATVDGRSLSAALEICYVNRPAGPAVESCVKNAFKTHYSSLLTEIDNFQRCAAATPSQ
jgi:hypothetical protein